MLKLFKFNFKNLFKSHLIYILVLVVSLLTFWGIKSFDFTNETLMQLTNIIGGLFIFVLILMMALLIVFTFVMIIVSFKRKVLGDEGYLTHTLPLTTGSIVRSYYLTAFVYLLIDIIVLILAITAFDKILGGTLTAFIDTQVEFSSFGLATGFIILSFFVFLGYVLLAFSLGYSKEDKKIRNTIFSGIILYFVNQVLSLIPVLIILLFMKDQFNNESTVVGINLFMIVMNIFYLCLSLISYTLVIRINTKKLNLE